MNSYPSPDETGNPVNLEAYSLLVTEDDIFCFEIIKYFLSETEVNLFYAETGARALEIIEKHQIDIVFTDLHLPDMDGFEILNLIRQTNKDLPVIAQTAFAFQKDKERVYKAGFNEIVIKPYSKEQLFSILNKYLITISQEC